MQGNILAGSPMLSGLPQLLWRRHRIQADRVCESDEAKDMICQKTNFAVDLPSGEAPQAIAPEIVIPRMQLDFDEGYPQLP